jgi:hypothetical protein
MVIITIIIDNQHNNINKKGTSSPPYHRCHCEGIAIITIQKGRKRKKRKNGSKATRSTELPFAIIVSSSSLGLPSLVSL